MKARPRRFLGIELGGSRRTAVVALDFFAQENKVFLAQIESPVSPQNEETPDEALIRFVNALEGERGGVDAPLSLPPCLVCEVPSCPGVRKCPREEVSWMIEEARRLKWGRGKLPTPYSQRPVDLLLRGKWQDEAIVPFPVDDSFGAGRAPLGARMQYLRRHFSLPFSEVNPRLALGALAGWYGLSAREVRRCRDLEEGVEHRLGILDAIGAEARFPGAPRLFFYKTDISALAQDLSAFDAFFCAFVALLQELDLLEEPEIPEEWGTILRPRKYHPDRREEL